MDSEESREEATWVVTSSVTSFASWHSIGANENGRFTLRGKCCVHWFLSPFNSANDKGRFALIVLKLRAFEVVTILLFKQ